MVLEYVLTDALEEVLPRERYKKLTWYVLVVQIIVSVLYHFGRTGGSGIYYGWTLDDYYEAKNECIQLEYESTNPKWNEYHCDDYFKISSSDDDHAPRKCKSLRNQNNDVYTAYSNWIIDGCEYRFASPGVDYYCAWDMYECDDYFSHIVNKENYWVEDYCKYKKKGEAYWCDWYFDNYDSPNYICKNHNSSTHKNWTHACNCKDYAGVSYHPREKKKCTDYSNTATYICDNNNINHSFYDDACSCKDFGLDAYEWYASDCNKEYNNENWLPLHAGISFPWVGGIWFVLAVWTTTLPQKFIVCFKYTFISLIINIVADTVNSFYFFGVTTGTLVGFSFIIVFPCLTLMKKAFKELKKKDVICRRTIALNKIQIILLIGLAQLYISLPAYQHTFEQSLGEQDETNTKNESKWFEDDIAEIRHLIPIATGGILNVGYVVSILFVDITRLHYVDFLDGNTYNLEFIIGLLQIIGFAFTLGLNALGLPTEEKVVIEAVDPTEENDIPYVITKQYPDSAYEQYFIIKICFYLLIFCIGAIWIFISFLAARVKNDGTYMKYFENRWLKRETATIMEVRKEIIENHSIINKDEIIQLKIFIANELENLLIEIKKLFSDGINKTLFNNLLQTIQNEIYTTTKEVILPVQSIQEFGMLTSKQDLMEQWYNLSIHKVKKPLKKLKSKINEHLTNEENTFNDEENTFDKRRILLAENLTIKSKWKIPSITDNCKRLFCAAGNKVDQKMKMIEDETNERMDNFKTNVQISKNNLRNKILKNNINEIEVTKLFEEALVELEIDTQKELNKLLKYIINQNLSKYIKTKFNIIVIENLSSDKSMLEFVDLSSDTNYDDQFKVLKDKTFKTPLTALKDDLIDYLNKQKEHYGPQTRAKLIKISDYISNEINHIVTAIDNKEIEIRIQNGDDNDNQINQLQALQQSVDGLRQDNNELNETISELNRTIKELNEKVNNILKNQKLGELVRGTSVKNKMTGEKQNYKKRI